MDKKNSRISFIGITMGAAALLLAITHFWAGPFSPQPAFEQTVAEKAVAIKDAAIAALKGEEQKLPEKSTGMDIDEMLQLATAILGGLAIILAVLGFAKNEPLRAASGAALLGGAAIAFQFAVIALGVMVLAVFVFIILSQIGIG